MSLFRKEKYLLSDMIDKSAGAFVVQGAPTDEIVHAPLSLRPKMD